MLPEAMATKPMPWQLFLPAPLSLPLPLQALKVLQLNRSLQ